jgi:hypothetical protein
MSDPMEGYVFNSDEEKRQARKWFETHANEIPDMDAGLKINGDPIIYLGIPEEWQLIALLPEPFDAACALLRPSHGRRLRRRLGRWA